MRLKAPGASERLYRQVVEFVQRMRTLDLFKAPGVAETIDWTNALVALNAMRLDPASVQRHAGRAAQVPGRHRRACRAATPPSCSTSCAREALARLKAAAVTRRQHRPLRARAARRRHGRSGPTACWPRWRRWKRSAWTGATTCTPRCQRGDARPPRAAGAVRRRLRRLLARPEAARADDVPAAAQDQRPRRQAAPAARQPPGRGAGRAAARRQPPNPANQTREGRSAVRHARSPSPTASGCSRPTSRP